MAHHTAPGGLLAGAVRLRQAGEAATLLPPQRPQRLGLAAGRSSSLVTPNAHPVGLRWHLEGPQAEGAASPLIWRSLSIKKGQGPPSLAPKASTPASGIQVPRPNPWRTSTRVLAGADRKEKLPKDSGWLAGVGPGFRAATAVGTLEHQGAAGDPRNGGSCALWPPTRRGS